MIAHSCRCLVSHVFDRFKIELQYKDVAEFQSNYNSCFLSLIHVSSSTSFQESSQLFLLQADRWSLGAFIFCSLTGKKDISL